MKKTLKAFLIVLLVLIIVVLCYMAYVLISYYRLDDNITIDVNGKAEGKAEISTEYKITTWNIGFAAYVKDYGFFMDGGTESRAYSEESVISNMESIIEKLNSFESDFYFIQEVDFDSTRSYHVHEREMLIEGIDGDYDYTFAQNYDSPYLFYPILEPHGKSRSGLLTFSKYNITSSLRRSLPIQESLAKLVDLDRCYDINRIPVSNGKELILINLHLSAYTTDPTIVEKQIEMLNEDMVSEYEKGNYVIAGGDFNKDVLGDSPSYFGVSGEEYSWAKSYPMDLIPDNFTLVQPIDLDNPIPSCRNADGPWDSETQFQVTLDSFLVSDNIEITEYHVIDTDFENSDHNPVQMTFVLK